MDPDTQNYSRLMAYNTRTAAQKQQKVENHKTSKFSSGLSMQFLFDP